MAGSARAWSQPVGNWFWCIGSLSLALKAYLVQDWRYMYYCIGIPGFLITAVLFLMPESLHWLHVSGKGQTAGKMIKSISKWNKVDEMEIVGSGFALNTVAVDKSTSFSPLEVLKYPQLRKMSFIAAYLWFTFAIVYHGLIFSSVGWFGDPYTNFALQGLVELPASFICLICCKYLSRKTSVSLMLSIAGTSCVLAYVLAQTMDRGIHLTILGMVGKMTLSSAWIIGILHHSEMYPTNMRASGLAFICIPCRFSGVIAPFLTYLSTEYGEVATALPFGIMALIGAALNVFLPETAGMQLYDRPEDMPGAQKEESQADEVFLDSL